MKALFLFILGLLSFYLSKIIEFKILKFRTLFYYTEEIKNNLDLIKKFRTSIENNINIVKDKFNEINFDEKYTPIKFSKIQNHFYFESLKKGYFYDYLDYDELSVLDFAFSYLTNDLFFIDFKQWLLDKKINTNYYIELFKKADEKLNIINNAFNEINNKINKLLFVKIIFYYKKLVKKMYLIFESLINKLKKSTPPNTGYGK